MPVSASQPHRTEPVVKPGFPLTYVGRLFSDGYELVVGDDWVFGEIRSRFWSLSAKETFRQGKRIGFMPDVLGYKGLRFWLDWAK